MAPQAAIAADTPQIDTALASRDDKGLRGEEKANLSAAFNIFDGTGISGAQSDRLQLTNVDDADEGTYSVIVTNDIGSVTSDGWSCTAGSIGSTIAVTTPIVRFSFSSRGPCSIWASK